MKDFLEGLEIGEEKLKLSKEQIKSILAENGKIVDNEKEKIESKYKTDIESYEKTINELKDKIEKSPKSEDLENLKTEIAKYEQEKADRDAKEKAKAEDDILTKNINDVISDKKFVNEYTKNSIVNEIKVALKNEANMGKSAKDLFEEITNGKDDLFENPNQMQDMSGVDENVETGISKEAFDKMGYKERVELKQSNPELFKKYNE